MKIQELLLLRVFCYDNLKNDDYEVTYLLKQGRAIVENSNGDCILLVAKENNIVECYEENSIKPFRTMQFIEGYFIENFHARLKYDWKDL